MRNRLLALLLLGAIVVGSGVAIQQRFAEKISLQASTEQTGSISTVAVGAKKFVVEVAATNEEKSQGLSSRTRLAKGTGMLFIFKPAEIQSFWMRDMKFPLDIVWISNNKIIGIERNAAIPAPETRPENLKLYSPPGAVDYVLELNAGEGGELKVGDSFNLEIAKGV